MISLFYSPWNSHNSPFPHPLFPLAELHNVQQWAHDHPTNFHFIRRGVSTVQQRYLIKQELTSLWAIVGNIGTRLSTLHKRDFNSNPTFLTSSKYSEIISFWTPAIQYYTTIGKINSNIFSLRFAEECTDLEKEP